VHEVKRIVTSVVIAALCIACGGGTALAGEEEAGSGWEYRVVPYLWLTGMEADVTVKGDEGNVSASFGDLWTVHEYGGSLSLEARKGRLAIMANGIYVQESLESTDTPATADVKRLRGELSLAYRPSFLGIVELVGGAMFNDLLLDVAVEDGPAVSVDDSWIDPVVGLQARKVASERVSFVFRGDVGGFNLNDVITARLVIQAELFLTDSLYFVTAYRFGYMDYDTDELGAEVMLNGVALGLGYHF